MFLLIVATAFAQQETTAQQPDSIILPQLTASYYEQSTFLTHQYNYEILNKQRRMRRMANDIEVMGSSVILAMSFIGGGIANNAGWSIGVYIPCASVVSLGTMGLLIMWSDHLRKKADALNVSSAYLLPVGKSSKLGVASFAAHETSGPRAFGISLKTNF
jgi:hypothetical protein